jgi:prevent-host-death family protein
MVYCMTRIAKQRSAKPAKAHRRKPHPKSGHWLLQDCKAQLGELVRRACSEGPQRVTANGREEVVVVSARELRRLKGDPTGESLIAAMQASPHRDVELEPGRRLIVSLSKK